MANNLSYDERLRVLHLALEGASLRSITRLTGTHRTTAMNLILRTGERCRDFLDRWMRNLTLEHVEIDELWTFVLKKQGRIPVGADDSRIGDVYLFLAIDDQSKLIPSFRLGKRCKAVTHAFCQDLASRLVIPELFDPYTRLRLSTDGYTPYKDAIDDAFNGRAAHGVLIKKYRNSDMPGRYGPPELIDTDRRVIVGDIEESEICTSHAERQNLSIRTFLRRFTRLALGFSKKFESLDATIALYIAHYNFCRMHGNLNGTPAMAARIAGHPWTLAELIERVEE